MSVWAVTPSKSLAEKFFSRFGAPFLELHLFAQIRCAHCFFARAFRVVVFRGTLHIALHVLRFANLEFRDFVLLWGNERFALALRSDREFVKGEVPCWISVIRQGEKR